jgi:hypothetical protein
MVIRSAFLYLGHKRENTETLGRLISYNNTGAG